MHWQVNLTVLIVGGLLAAAIGYGLYAAAEGFAGTTTCNLSKFLASADAVIVNSAANADCEFQCRSNNHQCCLMAFTTETTGGGRFNLAVGATELPAADAHSNVTYRSCHDQYPSGSGTAGSGCICCIKSEAAGGQGFLDDVGNLTADLVNSQINAGNAGRQNTCGWKGALNLPTYVNSLI
jgi:hypothetical protein